MISRTYNVVGMTCDHCVRAVSDEVNKIEGVDTVDVDLASGGVTVQSERELDGAIFAAAIDEAGYELAP